MKNFHDFPAANAQQSCQMWVIARFLLAFARCHIFRSRAKLARTLL